jgi:hypothetical protein
MSMPKKRCIAVMGLAIGFTAGCGTHGELGTGNFSYKCVDKSDASCGSVSLPALMAKGSRANISFSDDDRNNFTVIPAAPRLASLENGAIVFHEAGVVALVAHRGTEQVGDLAHVSIAVLDHLAVTSAPVSSPMGPLPIDTIPMGQQGTVSAKPIGPAGESLAGALAYTWQSSDPTIATVTPPTAPDHEATVVAKALGTTTIQASAGGVTGQITLTVTMPVTP